MRGSAAVAGTTVNRGGWGWSAAVVFGGAGFGSLGAGVAGGPQPIAREAKTTAMEMVCLIFSVHLLNRHIVATIRHIARNGLR